MATVVAIGDIHGMYDQLIDLTNAVTDHMKQHEIDDYEVVFVGDYFDRGPKSAEVFNYLRDRPFNGHDVTFLGGNHEEMLFDRNKMFFNNGGMQTEASFLANDIRYKDVEQWLVDNTKSFKVIDNHLFVHAGIDPRTTYHTEFDLARDYQTLLWIRDPFLNHNGPFKFGKDQHEIVVVHGHTPVGVEIELNRINCDSGACYTGKLSAVIINDTTVVGAKSNYDQIIVEGKPAPQYENIKILK